MYGSDNSARFVNGALGAFSIQGGIAAVPALAALKYGEAEG